MNDKIPKIYFWVSVIIAINWILVILVSGSINLPQVFNGDLDLDTGWGFLWLIITTLPPVPFLLYGLHLSFFKYKNSHLRRTYLRAGLYLIFFVVGSSVILSAKFSGY